MLLPVWIGSALIKDSKKQWDFLVYASLLLMIVPVVLASIRTNFQPWYVLFFFPFVAFSKKLEIMIGFSLFSFAILLQYIPFLYTGNWNPPIPFILSLVLWVGLGMAVLAAVSTLTVKQLVAKRKHSTVQ